jgi:adenylate cyclase
MGSEQTWPKAREAAKKALALDETLGEAHLTLARIMMNFDWDWQGAEREVKRSIELNPNKGTPSTHNT